MSDVLQGKRPPQRDLVESLLGALRMSPGERALVMRTWARLTDQSHTRQSEMPRVADMSARELGVHAAIRPAGSPGEVPSYVERAFDPELRGLIQAGAQDGCFVVLVGNSSTGKTRSLFEAVRDVAGQRWLIQPSDTGDIHRLLESTDPPSVVWLDELTRFFGATPALTKLQVARLKRARHIVVGTMWFEEYAASKAATVERDLLGFAEIIDVPRNLDPEEHQRARTLARSDAGIRAALEAPDGLIQVLAAGPDLLRLYRHASPFAHAAITAAADARRLGILTPLPQDVLVAAMTDYLGETDRVTPPDTWWSLAAVDAERQINETTVSALYRVADREPGTMAGYRAADYLAQHLRTARRTACPPASFWTALIDGLDGPEDLRRLHDAAAARMRFRAQERALRRLAAARDDRACVDLAFLLVRQDRIGEAVEFLAGHLGGRATEEALAAVITLRGRAESLQGAERAELLYDRGELADLRERAEQGDATAADDYVTLLADRGDLTELRRRAAAGHRLAEDLLAELPTDTEDDGSAAEEIASLRQEVGDGDMDAAERLTSLLFDLGNEAELRAEVEAGTFQAADRFLALLMVNGSGDVLRLRASGVEFDGTDERIEGKDNARH